MNEFENYLQEKAKEVKARKIAQGNMNISENVIYTEISIERRTEMLLILKDSPDYDTDPALEVCVYAEARGKGYSPEHALEKTKGFIEQYRLKNNKPYP